MTVLRREVARSERASPGGGAFLSQSCDAHPLDRACLHPPTSTSESEKSGEEIWGLGGLDLPHGGPDETGELSGDGDGDLGPGLSALEHMGETAVETSHGLVGEGDGVCGLALSARAKALDSGPMAVVPGSLDEEAANMSVAGL